MPVSWIVAGAAGMVAAFNPCGIALFPSYLMYLLSGRIQRPAWGYWDGLRAGVLMTVGFVLLFGAAGLLVSGAGQILFGAAPFISILMAVLLWITAVFIWRGSLHVSLPTNRWTAKWDRMFTRGSSGSFFAYGVGYGLASLSCSLPVFVSVASQGFGVGFALGLGTFLSYAVGMGVVITVFSVAATTARTALENFIRTALPYVQKLSAIIMVVAGGYLIWYWIFGPRGVLSH